MSQIASELRQGDVVQEFTPRPIRIAYNHYRDVLAPIMIAGGVLGLLCIGWNFLKANQSLDIPDREMINLVTVGMALMASGLVGLGVRIRRGR